MKKRPNSFEFLIFNFEFSDSKLKIKDLKFVLSVVVLFFALAANEQAEQPQIPLGHATDFTSNQYFKPPNQKQVAMRLSGLSASPLPGGLLSITDLKIEMFETSGKIQAIMQAPQCTFAPFEGLASSAGHLELQTGDGSMRTTGDGFLWRQSDNSLTISNHVHTVILTKDLKLSMP
jgi:hypothetical protein